MARAVFFCPGPSSYVPDPVKPALNSPPPCLRLERRKGGSLHNEIKIARVAFDLTAPGSEDFWHAAWNLVKVYRKLDAARLPGFVFPHQTEDFLTLWRMFPASERFILLTEHLHELLTEPAREPVDLQPWLEKFGDCLPEEWESPLPNRTLPTHLLDDLSELLVQKGQPRSYLTPFFEIEALEEDISTLDWAGIRTLMRPITEVAEPFQNWDHGPLVRLLAKTGRLEQAKALLKDPSLPDPVPLRLTAENWHYLRSGLSPHEETAWLNGLESKNRRLEEPMWEGSLTPALAAAWAISGQFDRCFALLQGEDFPAAWNRLFEILADQEADSTLLALGDRLTARARQCQWQNLLSLRLLQQGQTKAAEELWHRACQTLNQLEDTGDFFWLATELGSHELGKQPSGKARSLDLLQRAFAAWQNLEGWQKTEAGLWRIHQGFLNLKQWQAALACEKAVGPTAWNRSRQLAEALDRGEQGDKLAWDEALLILTLPEPETGMGLGFWERCRGLLLAWNQPALRDQVAAMIQGLDRGTRINFWGHLIRETLRTNGLQGALALWYGVNTEIPRSESLRLLEWMWISGEPQLQGLFKELAEEASPDGFKAEIAWQIAGHLDQNPTLAPEILPDLLRWTVSTPAYFLGVWSIWQFFQAHLEFVPGGHRLK